MMHSFLTVLFLLLIAASVVLTIRDIRASLRPDVIMIEGFDDSESGRAAASDSVAAIRSAYRDAGRARPIVLNVPPGIFIKRDPR